MLTSCTSWLSKCRTPRTGDVGRSPTAPASLSAASPPVTPAEPAVTDQQVLYPDEHAQKLAELEPIPYHMPETAVAPLLGFGDDVTALRRWVRKMDSHGGIWAFQAYEDTYLDKGKGPRYWIIGNCFKPTAADAGINCTVSEQLTVTGILQAEAKAVRYGLGQLDEELAGASVANTWFGVLQDIAHAHPEVFNLQSVVNADRPNRREITKAYIAAIKEMLKLKVFALDPEPRTPKQAVDKPPTSSAAAAEPARAASAPDTLPRRLRFKDPDAAGHDRRAFTAQTRIAFTLMEECRVPQTQMPKVLTGILRTFGFVLEGPLPTRDLAQQICVEGGILANSIIAQQLLDWGLSGAQDVTFSIDGVSIGEYKGMSAAFVKMVAEYNAEGERTKKFVRIALPLIELPSGSDEDKQKRLLSDVETIIKCFNAIKDDCTPEMELYDVCRIVGFAVNDHAESVLRNKIAPWVTDILETKIGKFKSEAREGAGAQEDIITPFILLGKGGPALPVRCQHDCALITMSRDGQLESRWQSKLVKSTGDLIDAHEYLSRKQQTQQRPALPKQLIMHILELRYGTDDVFKIRRSKLKKHAYYCEFHSQCVCVKGGVSAVAAGEKQGLVAQQLQLEDAASPPGRYQASSRAQAAVMTVSKAIGKPKRVHETLSHGALNLSIKQGGRAQDEAQHQLPALDHRDEVGHQARGHVRREPGARVPDAEARTAVQEGVRRGHEEGGAADVGGAHPELQGRGEAGGGQGRAEGGGDA